MEHFPDDCQVVEIIRTGEGSWPERLTSFPGKFSSGDSGVETAKLKLID